MAFGATVWAKGIISGIADNITELNALNNNLKHRDAKEMKKRFVDIIQVFSDAKGFSCFLHILNTPKSIVKIHNFFPSTFRFVRAFNDVFDQKTTAIFFYSLLVLGSSLLLLKFELVEYRYDVLHTPCLSFSFQILLVFRTVE